MKGGVRLLNCNEVNELISLYIDGALDEGRCCEFEEHIDSCEACRLQLEEMTQMVFACRELEEVELPDGFAEELHMKLAKANQNEKRKSGVLNFPYNKIKLFSTVAAMFVLVLAIALLAKNTILTPSKTGSPPGAMKFAAKNSADSAVQENAKAKKAESGNSGERKDMAGSNTDDSVAMQAAGSDGSNGTKQFGTSTTETASRSSSTPSGTAGTQGANTLVAVTAADAAAKQTVDIQIVSSDVKTLAEEIDKIAIANKGERAGLETQFSDVITSSITSSTTASTESGTVSIMAAGTESDQPDRQIVEYMIPNDKYNDFINSLTTTYGQTGVITNKPALQDLSADLDALNKQAAEIDEKIKQAENDEVTLAKDDLLKLQEEKKLLEQKISELKTQTQYTYVTIELKKQ
jgi:hypothetical protein